MPRIEYENIFKNALYSEVNLFVGAGFSILANNKDEKPLPLGRALAEEIVQFFGVDDLAGLPLGKLCTVLNASRKAELTDFLRNRFTVESFSDEYKSIERLDVRSIFTTNIDNLIFHIYADSQFSYINDIRMRGVEHGNRTSINFIPLHGCVVDEDPHFVFEVTELTSQFSKSPDKWYFLTQALQDHSTLFWGYGIEDSGVLQALNIDMIEGREHQPKWIILRNDERKTVEYFKALGFHIIIADTQEMLQYISDLQFPSTEEKSVRIARGIFEDNRIPSVGMEAVRPLHHFLLGAAPIWPDIFHRRLHKTKYFHKVSDLINSGTHAIVLGIPACGKTTLLMQVAFETKFSGEKFIFFDCITAEKAKLIARTLANSRALLFVDNFADDIEGFRCLSKFKNIQLVGFDRDYNFEMAGHLIDIDDFEIIDITELDDMSDVQEILSRIPDDIRTNVKKDTKQEENLSIFELVEINTVFPKLKVRFGKVLKELEEESKYLPEILVMSCYVQSCRTPVSLGMLYAYLRNEFPDRSDIEELRKKLGAMIREYEVTSCISERDFGYFASRSTHISEAILGQVKPEILKTVLTKFYQQLSRFRICRYDVFKRHAYDSRLIAKAFPEWQEGKAFYNMILSNVDYSYYIKQQGALYLAGKRKFRDAFQWIDEAWSESKYRAFTIHNSHAVILFNANYYLEQHQSTVRTTLDESMDILEECYHNDRRKWNHALKFADQAVRYYEKYRDTKALDYLHTAKEWLIEEMNRSEGKNRRLERHYKRVCKVLRGLK